MTKDFRKRVFGLKLSVFGDGDAPSVDGVDFQLIRVPGFGRYRKAMVGIGRLKKISDFQIIKLSDLEAKVQEVEGRFDGCLWLFVTCEKNGTGMRVTRS